MKNSSKVILNTGILYGKMLITMIITLLSTRWILQALGAEDYGIYSLVAGIIVMLSFLNTALSGSTQRFLSYNMGKGDADNLKEVFYYSVLFHLFVGIVVLLLFELGGIFFLKEVLVIPTGKEDVVLIVLHCLSVSTFFTIISVPYQAILNARENFLMVAIIGIIESVLKLAIAIVLLKYGGDRLILYAVLMMFLSLNSIVILRFYCKRKYHETHIQWMRIKDTVLFKSMASFALWNLIGSITNLARGQGIAMLLNTFFGVIANAAYGIAYQVNGQVTFFSGTISKVMRPQVVMSEGEGDRARMLRLSLTNSKITFLLLAVLCVPLIVEMQYALSLWLKNVPEYTIIFCQMVLLIALLFQLSTGLFMIVESVGNIKWNQIFIGSLHILVLPAGYFCLKKGFPAFSVFLCIIIEEFIALCLRTYFAKKIGGLSIKYYVFKVFVPSVSIVISAYILSLIAKQFLSDGLIRLGIIIVFSSLIILLGGFKFALSKDEKGIITNLISSFINKVGIKYK